jgi:hypothetical protein
MAIECKLPLVNPRESSGVKRQKLTHAGEGKISPHRCRNPTNCFDSARRASVPFAKSRTVRAISGVGGNGAAATVEVFWLYLRET